MEIWLRSNRRALLLGMLLPALLAAIGLALVWLGRRDNELLGSIGVIVGYLLLAVGALTIAGLAWVLRLPRIARNGDQVLFFMRGGQPIRVPLDAVEAFLAGKTESVVGRDRLAESAAIVVRIADRYRDYHERAVKPSLGSWKDGYVSIRGTWCEPISIDVIKRLNRRLNEARREEADQEPTTREQPPEPDT